MSNLEQVKVLLGISGEDRDALITEILDLTQSRLLSLIAQETVPEELGYIVTEAAVRRFNRIGSEGTSSHTVDGESMTWAEDDFAPFMDDIQRWRDAHGSAAGRKVVFL